MLTAECKILWGEDKVMISREISLIIDELIPIFKQLICGEYSISLAGSYAKGKADIHSDLDIFIYTEGILPYEEREKIIRKIADSNSDIYITKNIDMERWGGSIDFYYKEYKIETTLRNLNNLNEIVNESINGNIKVYPEFWTLGGYYNYICLSEIDFIKSLEDPYKIVSNLKERVKTYPEALKKAIINEFWWKSDFWLDNFHYISAIKRKDIVYTSGVIQHTFHSIVQVLFALNEKYFHGDKKIELQLNELSFCPKELVDNIEFLLTVNKEVNFLEKQREILKNIVNEIGNKIKEG